MSPVSSPSFLVRVRNELHQMHPAERVLAEFVLSFPGELASYTAAELAQLAHVSSATVSRFIRKLGYVNYEEARRLVRAEQKSGAALFLGTSQIDDLEQVLRAHVEQGKLNLEQVFLGVTLREIDAVARAMLTARHVWIIGFRTSHSFATYLRWQVFQVIEHVTAVPHDGHTLAEYLAGIQKEDAVVFFGLKRLIKTTDSLLEQIIKTKAQILYVSDQPDPRRNDVNWHFQCPTMAPGPLFNHVSVMGLTHLLATRVVELAGKKGRKRLLAIESIHHSLDEL